NEALAMAASVESGSVHPVAHAVVEAAAARGLLVPPPSVGRVLPGVGVEAVVQGRTLRLGNRRLLDHPPDDANSDITAGMTLHLVEDQRLLATLVVSERLRPDAPAAIDRLRRMGITLRMLSGDRSMAARRVADQLAL